MLAQSSTATAPYDCGSNQEDQQMDAINDADGIELQPLSVSTSSIPAQDSPPSCVSTNHYIEEPESVSVIESNKVIKCPKSCESSPQNANHLNINNDMTTPLPQTKSTINENTLFYIFPTFVYIQNKNFKT